MLSIIVPCYNEADAIPYFFAATEEVITSLGCQTEYIFVNDGSKDETLTVLRNLHQEHPDRVRYLSFSRNFGKEAAIFAGLKACRGDYITLMDADLQDPPELLPQMFELIQSKEVDCVGTRRTTRKGEPPIRSFFARLFYKIINRISQTEIVDGARDYRLMTRQMVDAILELSEYNRFSKGLFSWVGFDTIYLEFENRDRVAGQTSWNFFQLLRYSIDGIINFSDAPLTLASIMGTITCLISAFFLVVIIVRALLFGDRVAGWPSIVSIILFFSGIQLLSLGIIGNYIGKIFMETKRRPIYIIKETETSSDKKNEA
ncbi:glycosyltransferase family 2 protein [uncultured Abiotrophia sp.]|uniref:glycosyltransferase family 2 protein n=1 Tax=uncultured Abiotrophia sp. TaxID=316094 RepID=UPI00260A6AAF|nr:glycosyltransferase family 2 protein [uncultured Abiotrophia sp.]